MLSLFMEELHQKQINIYWTGLIGPLRDQFYKAGFLDQFDGLFVFSSLEAAINAIQGTAPTAIEKTIASQRNNT